MNLADNPLSKNWLNKFDEEDRKSAEFLLRSLRLVSFSEVESAIKGELQKIEKNTKGMIALIPIRKLKGPSEIGFWKRITLDIFVHLGVFKKSKTIRKRYGSEDRFGHMLVSLEREFPKRFIVEPTLESIRNQRVKHIILVDDIIGSGERVISFWRQYSNPSIRSWLSSKHCQLWLVTYAADTISMKRVSKTIGQLEQDRFIVPLKIDRTYLIKNKKLLSLGVKYGPGESDERAITGYQGTLSNVIFQHGCPNNAPRLLWKNTKNWTALFPNRSIPKEFFDCFDQPIDSGFHIERLKQTKQVRLALAIEEAALENRMSKQTKDLLITLGLLSKGIKIERLYAYLMETQSEIEERLKKAQFFGLLTEDGKLTELGIDLVLRTLIGKRRMVTKAVDSVAKAIKFYYP